MTTGPADSQQWRSGELTHRVSGMRRSAVTGQALMADDCPQRVARNLPGVVAVCDSKDPAGPELIFEPAQWAAFTRGVKTGDSGLR